MSHTKIIVPGSYTFDDPIIQEVTLSRRGILDGKSAFEKRACVEILRDLPFLREKVASDETLIHMLAIGATEDYGANRNGDGFRRVTCEQSHPTFVKHAWFYRNHKNKDPRKSYGRLVKSAWNEPMRRVELLVALNSTDAAARRNGGLLADCEMEKLAAGKDIPVSMACHVPYDVCSYCGNKAPTTKHYCLGTYQGGHCKAGGLRDNIGALVEIDGGIHQLHADNPNPRFFDISHVFRPADRIAYVTGVLEKAAAAHGQVIKSAELAKEIGVTVPFELMIDNSQPVAVRRLLKVAYQLADIENEIEQGQLPVSPNYVTIFNSEMRSSEPLELPPLFREKFSAGLRALTDARICLPLDRFIEIVADQPFEKAAEAAAVVIRELPGIFTRLVADNDLPARIKESQYAPAAAVAPPVFEKWAVKLASEMSLASSFLQQRVTRAALHQVEAGALRPSLGREKCASVNDPVRRMAEEYALYQLSFLGSISETDPDLPLTASLTLLQNYAN